MPMRRHHTGVRSAGHLTGRWAAVLRVVAAAGLAVSAYIHAGLAVLYGFSAPGFTQGKLFAVQAGVASLFALWVLVRGRTLAWLAAGALGAASLAAVVMSRYAAIPAIGPLPRLYEPGSWTPDVVTSAIAEGVVVAVAVLWALTAVHRARTAAPVGARQARHTDPVAH